ncbi:sugar transferase [Aliikangiella sp. IMCC44653]
MKRYFDLVTAIIAFIGALPVFICVALLIYFIIGRPIFFRQARPGLHGKVFYLLKFRSMSDERDSGGELFPDEVRLGKFGKFLRSSSLDELPGLLNVINGDMSLVGPRPLLVEYLEHYDDEQVRRHEVKPGITGWAQVNGRNNISWEERFKLDVWYVDNQSFVLDLKILALTVLKVLKRSDINSADHATMKKFSGTKYD